MSSPRPESLEARVRRLEREKAELQHQATVANSEKEYLRKKLVKSTQDSKLVRDKLEHRVTVADSEKEFFLRKLLSRNVATLSVDTQTEVAEAEVKSVSVENLPKLSDYEAKDVAKEVAKEVV